MTKHDAADMLREEGAEALRARVDQDIGVKRKRANGSARPQRFKFKRFEDIKPSMASNYLIQGLLPRQGLAVIWGQHKGGKSFVAYDAAMHIALGWEYRGRRVLQGTVAYLAVEGGVGFAKRVEAWRRRHLADHHERVPFHLLDVPLDLIGEHADLIADIREQIEDAPAAIFVDTLNRTLVGDENSSADMAKLIRAAGALHLAFGCLVVLIHHCGLVGNRPRGHSSLAGANDVQISVSKDTDGLITVTTEHMKDHAPGEPFGCRLEPVEIGLDQEGARISSCVVVPAELPSARNGARIRTNANQDRFLDILRAAIREARPEHRCLDMPDSVSREWLKKCCASKGWIPEPDSNNSRAKVSNMINALAGKRLIGTNNLYVWSMP